MGDGTAQSPSNYYESKHFDEEGRNAKKLCSFKTIHSSCDHHRKCNTMVISVYHGQCSCFSYAILCGSDGVANSISEHDKVQSSHCRTPETRQVREIFHHVLEDYPDFKNCLAINTQIVHDNCLSWLSWRSWKVRSCMPKRAIKLQNLGRHMLCLPMVWAMITLKNVLKIQMLLFLQNTNKTMQIWFRRDLNAASVLSGPSMKITFVLTSSLVLLLVVKGSFPLPSTFLYVWGSQHHLLCLKRSYF